MTNNNQNANSDYNFAAKPNENTSAQIGSNKAIDILRNIGIGLAITVGVVIFCYIFHKTLKFFNIL